MKTARPSSLAMKFIIVASFLTGCAPAIPATLLPPSTGTAVPIPSAPASLAPATPTATLMPPHRVLQEGNSFRQVQLQTQDSRDLPDNRIGLYIHGLWEDAWDPEDWLNREAFGLGVTRMRFAVNELDVGMVDWGRSEFQFTPQHEAFMRALAENGIISTYILSFWDKQHHTGPWGPAGFRFTSDEEIEEYLAFVRFVVSNVRSTVQYYDLWNEPDVNETTQGIRVARYIELVRRTVPVIHEECPEARITISVADTSDASTREYLFTLLRSDVMPLVDVVSWHPMFGSSPEFEAAYYHGYPQLVQQIEDLAHEHGFGGEFWATEISYGSPECSWCPASQPTYSAIAAAKYYARAIISHLGMDVTVGVGGMSSLLPFAFPTVRNICTLMAGAVPVELPLTIESEASGIRSYAFALPNGENLVALWTDGVAVDQDPGVRATLTIPAVSASRVTAVDILYGAEQEIVTSNEGGNLVIRNLLVKDYPVVLRLSP